MLDKPEKTRALLSAMKAALPFEVELTGQLITYFATQQTAVPVKPRQMVQGVSYMGDDGGIVCHIQPDNTENALVVSLTHIRVHRPLPLAAAVFDYQKHRIKKMKKQKNL